MPNPLPTPLCCTECGAGLTDYADVAYDGPARDGRPDMSDPANRCDPWAEWLILCTKCYAEVNEITPHRRPRQDP